MPTNDKPPTVPGPPPLEQLAKPRTSGSHRVSLERQDKPAQAQLALSMAPPRSIEERVAVLEFHIPRLEKSMQAGFEDLKETCFLPLIARQDATATATAELKREVEGVIAREKSLRWWAGKVIEKGSQVLSIAVFGWLWWNDSGLAAKISAWWFRIFF